MTSTGGSKKLRKLEDDFNGGDPIDLIPYQKMLSMVGCMGFSTEEALEAALVTGTYDSITITNYILLSPVEKKKKYEIKKKESEKKIKISPEQEKHIEELIKLQQQIQQENFKINQLEQELKERQTITKLEKCAAYLDGILADEKVTEKEAEAVEKYLNAEGIDEKTFEEALKKNEANLTVFEFWESPNSQDVDGKMCFRCEKYPKQYCLFPCMHVILCEKCAKSLLSARGPGSGVCPACEKQEDEEIKKKEKEEEAGKKDNSQKKKDDDAAFQKKWEKKFFTHIQKVYIE